MEALGLDASGRAEPPPYLQEVFGQDGYLAKLFPGYQPRPGQIRLAATIDRGIRHGRHVIGEGPTGTGKSLAYSVPAVYHAVHHGKRVCIVTANKNLQRQIYQKDLADLAKAVPWKFTYAIRKGMNSYLCRREFAGETWQQLKADEPAFATAIEDTARWAERTQTGDFEDSPGPPPKVWSAFSTSRDECDGRKCPEYEDCYANLARQRSLGAHVTVTNYHLFLLHLKYGAESKILPPFDIVILDEAHNAATIAREFFGDEVTWGSIYRCVASMHTIEVASLRRDAHRVRDAVLTETNRLWAELAARARRRQAMLSQDTPVPSEALESLLGDAEAMYRAAVAAVTPAAAPDQKSAQGAAYLKLAERCLEKKEILAGFRTVANDRNVYFIEGSGNDDKAHKVKLKSKAIEVGGAMRALLFERYRTVIQTSATLAVRGGKGSDFAYLRREMGMNAMKDRADLLIEEVVVESPFDWPKQAMLVIPRSMPTFQNGNEAWDQAVCDHLERTVNTVQGRTMGLFTSFRMLQKAAEHLRATTDWRVLVQGEATNRELAHEFQKDVHSVLLGTESFSEGVSIEGEACTCVVLDKIPFVNQDDPVMWALDRRLKARGGKESVFNAYQLPEAIISFKQRVGRLIRTVTDVGVVVVLDKRLLTKPYRTQFTKSIPPLRTEDSLDAIDPFLRHVGALA